MWEIRSINLKKMSDIGDSIFFSETPILEKFFSILEGGAVNYCIVCLRTENERLLVRPQYFTRFAKAIKIDKYWKHNYICNYCERQAYLALRFYTATKLSASVDTIFVELLYQKKKKVANVFSERQFRNILWSCDVENKNATPTYYEQQLRKIHYAADFAAIKPIVVDNFGVIDIKDPKGKMTQAVACTHGFKQILTRVADWERHFLKRPGGFVRKADIAAQTDIIEAHLNKWPSALVTMADVAAQTDITERRRADVAAQTDISEGRLNKRPGGLVRQAHVAAQTDIKEGRLKRRPGGLVRRANVAAQTNITMDSMVINGAFVDERLKDPNPQITEKVIFLEDEEETPIKIRKTGPQESLRMLHVTITPKIIPENIIDAPPLVPSQQTIPVLSRINPVTPQIPTSSQQCSTKSPNKATISRNTRGTSTTNPQKPIPVIKLIKVKRFPTTAEKFIDPEKLIPMFKTGLVNIQKLPTTASLTSSTVQNTTTVASITTNGQQNNQNIATSQNNLNIASSTNPSHPQTTNPTSLNNANRQKTPTPTLHNLLNPQNLLTTSTPQNLINTQNIPISRNNLVNNTTSRQFSSTQQNSPIVSSTTLNCRQNTIDPRYIIHISQNNLDPQKISTQNSVPTHNISPETIQTLRDLKNVIPSVKYDQHLNTTSSRTSSTTQSIPIVSTVTSCYRQNNVNTQTIIPTSQNNSNMQIPNTKLTQNSINAQTIPTVSTHTSVTTQSNPIMTSVAVNNIVPITTQQNLANSQTRPINPRATNSVQNTINTQSTISTFQRISATTQKNPINPQTIPINPLVTCSIQNTGNAQKVIITRKIITQQIPTTLPINCNLLTQNIPIMTPTTSNSSQNIGNNILTSQQNPSNNPILSPNISTAPQNVSIPFRVTAGSCNNNVKRQNVRTLPSQKLVNPQTIPTSPQNSQNTPTSSPTISFSRQNIVNAQNIIPTILMMSATHPNIPITSQITTTAPQNVPTPCPIISCSLQNTLNIHTLPQMPTSQTNMPTLQTVMLASQNTPMTSPVISFSCQNIVNGQNIIPTLPQVAQNIIPAFQTILPAPQTIIPSSQNTPLPTIISATAQNNIPTFPEMIISTQNISGTSNNAPVQREFIPITSQPQPMNPAPTTITSQPPISSPVVVETNTTQSSMIVPLENILQTSVELHTGLGVLLVYESGDCTTHPITVQEGVFKVPSLQAFIKDGYLVNYSGSPILLLGQEDMILNHISQLIPKSGVRPCPTDANVQLTNIASVQGLNVNSVATPTTELPQENKEESEEKMPMAFIALLDNTGNTPPLTPQMPKIEVEVPKISPQTWHHPY